MRRDAVTILAALLVLSGVPVAAAAGAGWEADPRPLATTLVYDCAGYEVVARLGPGEMAVWLPDRYQVLSRVRSASGAKYQEGDTLFWSKGETALLEVDGRRHGECRLQPGRAPWADARRRGARFRAVGNEPGWHLEIFPGRELVYVGDYGQHRLDFPDPGEQRDGPVRVYQAGDGETRLRLEIVDGPCTDNMNGDSFPSQVILWLGGRTLWGCGMDLPPLVK